MGYLDLSEKQRKKEDERIIKRIERERESRLRLMNFYEKQGKERGKEMLKREIKEHTEGTEGHKIWREIFENGREGGKESGYQQAEDDYKIPKYRRKVFTDWYDKKYGKKKKSSFRSGQAKVLLMIGFLEDNMRITKNIQERFNENNLRSIDKILKRLEEKGYIERLNSTEYFKYLTCLEDDEEKKEEEIRIAKIHLNRFTRNGKRPKWIKMTNKGWEKFQELDNIKRENRKRELVGSKVYVEVLGKNKDKFIHGKMIKLDDEVCILQVNNKEKKIQRKKVDRILDEKFYEEIYKK